MDFYKGSIPIIDDSSKDMLEVPEGMGRGYVPRDYNAYPETMFASPPSEMVVYKESEWDALYNEQEEKKCSLEHLYLPDGKNPVFPNLDQGPNGYCWMFSKGSAMMMLRLLNNQPIVRLNPTSTAALVKNFRDEGGWCGLGVEELRTIGMADDNHWPGNSRDRRNDTTEMRTNASKYRLVEEWYDLSRPVHGQKLTKLQLATCGFNLIPCPSDFMWWSHSVCQIRWVRIEKGSWGPLILNSWANWGRSGLAVLRGSKANADGAIALSAVTASH